MNLLQNTELIQALNSLIKEGQDVLNAPPDTRNKEIKEVILEAFKLGMIG